MFVQHLTPSPIEYLPYLSKSCLALKPDTCHHVQVEVRNKKIGKIKEKYEEKCSEIKDLTEEFQTQREDYLDSIRQQSQETKLLQQILEQVNS